MIHIIITLLIVGVLLYLITLIPMDAAIVTIIRVVVILCAVLYVLSALGLWHGAGLL